MPPGEKRSTTPNLEQRTTASIMFTDVVSFSKHSSIDEQRTFRALNRDFDIIYHQVAAHGGQVLNTMGDGMMIVFMSATSCMQCALGIQGDFYRQSLSRPIDGILEHRIGLHIGDVLLNGKNTMGDGVNQAARIQALARPNSIAMSREFHKMVENKTPFSAKYLGLRMTKNIPEPIAIYEVPPIDDAIRQKAAEALFTPPPSEVNEGATGRRGALMLVAAIILLVAAAAPIFMLRAAQKSAEEQARREGRGFAAGTGGKRVAENLRDRLQGHSENANNAPAAANNEAANNSEPTSISLTPDQISDIAAKTNSYDYAGVAAELLASQGAESPDGSVMINKFENLVQFKSWLDAEMSATSETAPIQITVDGATSKVFATPEGITVVGADGHSSTKKLWEYRPKMIEAMAEAVATTPPDANVPTTNATGWIGTFKEVHRLDQ